MSLRFPETLKHTTPLEPKLYSTDDGVARSNAFGQCVSSSGSWVEDRNRQPMYPIDSPPAESNKSVDDPYPSNIYWWQTNAKCPLLDWDRVHFCRLLRGRNIMLVGDSMTRQMLAKIALSVLSSGYSPKCPGRGQLLCADMPGIKHACAWGIKNGHLSLRNDSISNTTLKLFENPWRNSVLEFNTSILILNKGAHYEDDDNFVSKLKETLDFVDSLPPSILRIWRNTVAGHRGCVNFTRPIPARMSGEMPFHWDKFQHQNQLAESMIRSRPEFVYMDVDTMTSLRPDHHAVPPRDCLHYLTGHTASPVDFWVLLFYNMLAVMDQ